MRFDGWPPNNKLEFVTKEQCAQSARDLNAKYYGLQDVKENGTAQCMLGNSYDQTGASSNCVAKGIKKNIPYGKGCANAVYKNENHDPRRIKYTPIGNRYCKKYNVYKRYYKNQINKINDCENACQNDPKCNAFAYTT